MIKSQLISMANAFVNEEFLEKNIKEYTSSYIDYKFNLSIEFAKITCIHFDIFRSNQDKTYKIKAMTIIELIILASDILDDLQDKDTPKDTPWYKVDDGQNQNIIIGLLLICLKKADDIGHEKDTKIIKKYINNYLLKSIGGQQMDLSNDLQNENDYIYMSYMKSGSLITIACFLGAGGNIDKQISEKIDKYANYLGLIYQLRNDLVDMKNGFIKSDLLFKKRTLPILYYLNTDDEAYRDIQDYYLNNSSDFDASMIHKDLLQEDALLYCSIVERIFIRKYQETIDQIDLSKKKKNILFDLLSN
ncbi:polyprenyl synthetase family protein [Oceanobacillus locisalsi]|uniref:Polyprenyl synthetase family protein n=1 Tax=Oceanobacillus locisalsi TaxID=546107 RepID=A0ABW3NFE1_9BACI